MDNPLSIPEPFLDEGVAVKSAHSGEMRQTTLFQVGLKMKEGAAIPKVEYKQGEFLYGIIYRYWRKNQKGRLKCYIGRTKRP